MAVGTNAYSDDGDILWAYLLDVRQLLHDASGDYFTDSDLVGYIKTAREQVAIDTGCLRTKISPTLPAGTEQFNFGGVYDITALAPAGFVSPGSLQSGNGGAATADNSTDPMTVAITTAGKYYQPPLVTFDAQGMNISAQASAVLNAGSLPQGISAINVNYDAGLYKAAAVVPNVIITPQGVPAVVTGAAGGALTITDQGSGQANGVILVDAAGTETDLAESDVSILDRKIAAVDAMNVIWGSLRVPMRNFAYSQFNVALRTLVGFQQVPFAFANYGSSVFIGPVPNQSFEYEMDCIMYPDPLVTLGQMGQFSDRSTRTPVRYYAAYLAKLGQEEKENALTFLEIYKGKIADSSNRFTSRMSNIFDNEGWD